MRRRVLLRTLPSVAVVGTTGCIDGSLFPTTGVVQEVEITVVAATNEGERERPSVLRLVYDATDEEIIGAYDPAYVDLDGDGQPLPVPTAAHDALSRAFDEVYYRFGILRDSDNLFIGGIVDRVTFDRVEPGDRATVGTWQKHGNQHLRLHDAKPCTADVSHDYSTFDLNDELVDSGDG